MIKRWGQVVAGEDTMTDCLDNECDEETAFEETSGAGPRIGQGYRNIPSSS